MDYQTIKLIRYKPRRSRTIISINKKGFLFNAACEKYMSRHYKYCELYYNKEQKVIAINPTNKLSENSIKISRHMRQNPRICARDFFKTTGIIKMLKFSKNSKSIKVFPIWNERNRMFLIDLKTLTQNKE